MNLRYAKWMFAGFLTPCLAAPVIAQTAPRKDVKPPQAATLTERQRAIQALNRLTFGPKPGTSRWC